MFDCGRWVRRGLGSRCEDTHALCEMDTGVGLDIDAVGEGLWPRIALRFDDHDSAWNVCMKEDAPGSRASSVRVPDAPGAHVTPAVPDDLMPSSLRGVRVQLHAPWSSWQMTFPFSAGPKSRTFSWGDPTKESYAGETMLEARGVGLAWLRECELALCDYIC